MVVVIVVVVVVVIRRVTTNERMRGMIHPPMEGFWLFFSFDPTKGRGGREGVGVVNLLTLVVLLIFPRWKDQPLTVRDGSVGERR